MAEKYLFPNELLMEHLVHNELEDVEDSHFKALSISRVMRYRAPDLWSLQDEEEIKRSLPNQSLYNLQVVVEKRRLGYVFLESLRMLNYRFPKIDSNLPITKRILWFLPSLKFAAIAINCCSQCKSFPEDCIPFFKRPEYSSLTGIRGDEQFLFRYCPLFRDINTELLLVFPVEENSELSLKVAVKGAMDKWGSHRGLLVAYSTLTSCQDGLLDTVISNDTTGASPLIDHLNASPAKRTWLNPMGHKKERALFRQMVWLAKLLIDIRQYQTSNSRSELLTNLQWELSGNRSPFNEDILKQNLSCFNDDSLLKYIRRSKLWRDVNSDDDIVSNVIGFYPTDSLVKCVSKLPIPSLESELPSSLSFHPVESNQFTCNDIHWFKSVFASSLPPRRIICGCQSVPGLPTSNMKITELAMRNCCNLTIECILYAKEKFNVS